MPPIGAQRWSVAEACTPGGSPGAEPATHLRFSELQDAEPVPRDTAYASVLESDRPVVGQHTRLDSR